MSVVLKLSKLRVSRLNNVVFSFTISVRNFSTAFPRRQSEQILIDVGLVLVRKLSNIIIHFYIHGYIYLVRYGKIPCQTRAVLSGRDVTGRTADD